MTKSPLVAVLKNAKLELVQEVELPLENFPDMVELPEPNPLKGFGPIVRQFFRIGITGRNGFYKEGVSYRVSQ